MNTTASRDQLDELDSHEPPSPPDITTQDVAHIAIDEGSSDPQLPRELPSMSFPRGRAEEMFFANQTGTYEYGFGHDSGPQQHTQLRPHEKITDPVMPRAGLRAQWLHNPGSKGAVLRGLLPKASAYLDTSRTRIGDTQALKSLEGQDYTLDTTKYFDQPGEPSDNSLGDGNGNGAQHHAVAPSGLDVIQLTKLSNALDDGHESDAQNSFESYHLHAGEGVPPRHSDDTILCPPAGQSYGVHSQNDGSLKEMLCDDDTGPYEQTVNENDQDWDTMHAQVAQHNSPRHSKRKSAIADEMQTTQLCPSDSISRSGRPSRESEPRYLGHLEETVSNGDASSLLPQSTANTGYRAGSVVANRHAPMTFSRTRGCMMYPIHDLPQPMPIVENVLGAPKAGEFAKDLRHLKQMIDGTLQIRTEWQYNVQRLEYSRRFLQESSETSENIDLIDPKAGLASYCPPGSSKLKLNSVRPSFGTRRTRAPRTKGSSNSEAAMTAATQDEVFATKEEVGSDVKHDKALFMHHERLESEMKEVISKLNDHEFQMATLLSKVLKAMQSPSFVVDLRSELLNDTLQVDYAASAAASKQDDMPELVAEYFSRAGAINVQSERLQELDYTFANETPDREFELDRAVPEDREALKHKLEYPYWEKREQIEDNLREDRRIAADLGERCRTAGLDPERYRNAAPGERNSNALEEFPIPPPVPEDFLGPMHGIRLWLDNVDTVPPSTQSSKERSSELLDFREHLPKRLRLRSSYLKQKNPQEFFKIGRVFRAAIPQQTDLQNVASLKLREQKFVSADVWSQPVISIPRRYVVVENHETHCFAVPIRKYNQELRKSEASIAVSDHVLVYSQPDAPSAFEQEFGDLLGPLAGNIRICPESEQDEIRKSSLVNLGNIHVVKHSSKVQPLGRVADEHLELLVQCYSVVRKTNRKLEKTRV